MLNYVEHEGEIVPSYTGPNAPSYPRGSARDTEMPHDFAPDKPEPAIETHVENSRWPDQRTREVGIAGVKAAKAEIDRIQNLDK